MHRGRKGLRGDLWGCACVRKVGDSLEEQFKQAGRELRRKGKSFLGLGQRSKSKKWTELMAALSLCLSLSDKVTGSRGG